MKKTWLALLLVLSIPLLASGCGTTPEPTPAATVTELPAPESPLATPVPEATIAPTPTIPEVSLAYTPAPEVGGVTGAVLRGDPVEPLGRGILYLGKIIEENGMPIMTGVNKSTAPRASIGNGGQFMFTEVPPGRYALVLDVIATTVILRNPTDGSDMLIDVVGGEIVDLGELIYPDMPPAP